MFAEERYSKRHFGDIFGLAGEEGRAVSLLCHQNTVAEGPKDRLGGALDPNIIFS